MTKMTGGEAIIKSLRANGVDTVFGLPGGQLDFLFDAMYKEGEDFRLIHTRHEQGTAYMAYGYAKSTGKVGTCAVVPGPGLLNAAGALCTAWSNYAPVLCISGQIPSTAIGKGYGDLHEIDDQLGMISHITKWSSSIDYPSQAPEKIAEAFKQLQSGYPRPVEVEMPMDIMALQAEVEILPAVTGYITPPVDEELVAEATEVLRNARKPMIVVGSGALEASDEIQALAERLQAPVMACRSGKGIVSSEHYLSANFPMGHRLWADTDAVLAIGTRLNWPLTMWGKDDDLKLIRVDIDPTQISRICKPEVGIVGDSAQVVQALLENLKDHRSESREEELVALKTAIDAEIRQKVGPQMAYLDVIREELPKDGIFVDEVTQVGFVSWYGFPVYKPRQHISAGYQGTLGYGYATALGVMAGNMDKKVIQISGDGGFMFTMQELATAVQYQLPLVTIIFNDKRFTNVQRQQKEWFDGRVICSDLHNPDFVKMAESFGAAGFKASDPETMRQAIRQAFDQRGPSIIEVAIDEFFPAPWPFLMMPQNRKSVCK
ncbi:thiamine pyrophosphate-dependent enzyme [Microbulbifer sp. 2201CG32-9]|uniref:thiamine pyrophosphate-dependent enzyme n=1 Tax=Microbulbifer sp. 2201CG32-9 TaxID=3232309 RepID=UPI00345B95E6